MEKILYHFTLKKKKTIFFLFKSLKVFFWTTVTNCSEWGWFISPSVKQFKGTSCISSTGTRDSPCNYCTDITFCQMTQGKCTVSSQTNRFYIHWQHMASLWANSTQLLKQKEIMKTPWKASGLQVAYCHFSL